MGVLRGKAYIMPQHTHRHREPAECRRHMAAERTTQESTHGQPWGCPWTAGGWGAGILQCWLRAGPDTLWGLTLLVPQSGVAKETGWQKSTTPHPHPQHYTVTSVLADITRAYTLYCAFKKPWFKVVTALPFARDNKKCFHLYYKTYYNDNFYYVFNLL